VPKQHEQEVGDPLVHAELKRILVPLDFSIASRRALLFTRDWAKRFGSEILLLHVIEPVNTYSVLGAESIALPVATADLHGPTRTELENLARRIFPRTAKVSVHLRDGAAYDQIITAARELDVDLIIIATHGRTGLSRALLGSTAERVVRHAPCPVLALRCGR
jgi:nucleotide-binding universal stress UspA family protein